MYCVKLWSIYISYLIEGRGKGLDHTTITGNPGRENDCGILLQDSSNDNALENNITSNNSEWEIILQGSCNDNELINNIA